MPDTIIRREIEVDAPVAQVWPYLATEHGLRQWWGNEIRLEPKPGGRCAERAVIGGKEVTQEGVVTVYDPPRQLTLTFAPAADALPFAPGGEPWPALQRISITLEEDGDRTRLAVVHQVLSAVSALTPRLPAARAAAHGPQARLPRGEAAHVPLPPGGARASAPVPLHVQRRWDMRLHTLHMLIAKLTQGAEGAIYP